jgi:hypothetical protein
VTINDEFSGRKVIGHKNCEAAQKGFSNDD